MSSSAPGDMAEGQPGGQSGGYAGGQVEEDGTNGDEFSFLYDLTSAPCFRQSTLYAIGGGAAIGGLQFVRTKDVMQSAETMVKTGCGIAILNWVVCRKRFYDEREATYKAMDKARREQAARAAAQAKSMRETEG